MMKSIFLECDCCSAEHTLKLNYDEEDGLYTTIYLNQYRNIFKRIWIAIKYIFGYKCEYGDFDCFLFKDKDIQKLSDIMASIVIHKKLK